jgi:hypothetical protein
LHADGTLWVVVISKELFDHFAVLREPPEAVEDKGRPLSPPPNVIENLGRAHGPADDFGLDIARQLRVLALDEVCAWLIPGTAGVGLITWDRRLHTCGTLSGPIAAAVDGTFVNRFGSTRGGETVYRAVGLAPDDVTDITAIDGTGSVKKLMIRSNVWTLDEEPPDGVVTLRWGTRETQRVPVLVARAPRG